MPIITSSAGGTVTATVSPTRCWLKDPTDPTRNIAVHLVSWAPKQNKKAAKFDPPGRTRSIVLHGTDMGDEGPLEVRTESKTEYDALKLLLDSNRVLLLQNVLGEQWYVEVIDGPQRTPERAQAPVGSTYPVRHLYNWSTQLVEVEPP